MSPIRLAINAIPFSPGGGLTGLLGLVQAFRKLSDEVDVTVFASKPEAIDALRALDAKVIPAVVGAALPQRMWWQVTQFDRELQRTGCDVLLSTNSRVPRLSVPQILHHQNLWCFTNLGMFDRPKDGMIKQFAREKVALSSLKRAEANVFVSEYLREVAEQHSPKTCDRNYVIHNGLDDSELSDASRGIDCWQGEPTICAVQPCVAQKDNPTLLRALASLASRRPEVPWRLRIAGGGNWEKCRELAASLGILERISWHGHMNRRELHEMLRSSLCLMFTSYFESFGNPPIEAMSQGCPAVAVRATAIPEVVGRAAILVDKGDADGFAAAAISLWDDPKRRAEAVSRGHQRALRYDWTASARKFLDIAKTVLHQTSSADPRTSGFAPVQLVSNAKTEAENSRDQAPEPADAVAFHDQLARDWEKKYQKKSFKAREVVLKQCLGQRVVSGTRWLDAGCGTGLLARTLASLGCSVVGVDAAPSMLRIAIAEANRSGLAEQLAFQQIRSIEQIEKPQEPYDGVLCNSVLEYVANPEMALRGLAGCLRPGGLILISVPNRRSLLRLALCAAHRLTQQFTGRGWPAYLRFSRNSYYPGNFAAMLNRHDFEVLNVVPFGGPFPVLLQRWSLFGPLNMFVARRL